MLPVFCKILNIFKKRDKYIVIGRIYNTLEFDFLKCA